MTNSGVSSYLKVEGVSYSLFSSSSSVVKRQFGAAEIGSECCTRIKANGTGVAPHSTSPLHFSICLSTAWGIAFQWIVKSINRMDKGIVVPEPLSHFELPSYVLRKKTFIRVNSRRVPEEEDGAMKRGWSLNSSQAEVNRVRETELESKV